MKKYYKPLSSPIKTQKEFEDMLKEWYNAPVKHKIPTTPYVLLLMDDEQFVRMWNSGYEFSEPISTSAFNKINERAKKLGLKT